MDSAKHPGCGPDLGSDLFVLFPSKGPLRPWAARGRAGKAAGCSSGASSRKDGVPSLRADELHPALQLCAQQRVGISPRWRVI